MYIQIKVIRKKLINVMSNILVCSEQIYLSIVIRINSFIFIVLCGILFIISMVIKMLNGVLNIFMVFKIIEFFKLIFWVMNIVGNQLISVYCIMFMVISIQEFNIMCFSNIFVSKVEYGIVCGVLLLLVIIMGGKGLFVWCMMFFFIFCMIFLVF